MERRKAPERRTSKRSLPFFPLQPAECGDLEKHVKEWSDHSCFGGMLSVEQMSKMWNITKSFVRSETGTKRLEVNGSRQNMYGGCQGTKQTIGCPVRSFDLHNIATLIR